MKIKHKRHKIDLCLFPITLSWEAQVSHILTSGGFHHTITHERVVFDEYELWESKDEIESSDGFLYWNTVWKTIEDKLDNGF